MARKKITEEPVKIVIPKRQARFYVHDLDFNPAAYVCDGVSIMRQRGESDEELRANCRASVSWPDANTQHSFIPIQSK